jgi:hypothetical protein
MRFTRDAARPNLAQAPRYGYDMSGPRQARYEVYPGNGGRMFGAYGRKADLRKQYPNAVIIRTRKGN